MVISFLEEGVEFWDCRSWGNGSEYLEFIWLLGVVVGFGGVSLGLRGLGASSGLGLVDWMYSWVIAGPSWWAWAVKALWLEGLRPILTGVNRIRLWGVQLSVLSAC